MPPGTGAFAEVLAVADADVLPEAALCAVAPDRTGALVDGRAEDARPTAVLEVCARKGIIA